MWGSDLFDLVYQAILDPERFDDLAAALAERGEAALGCPELDVLDAEPERFTEGFRHASILLRRMAQSGPARSEEFLVGTGGRIVSSGGEAESILGTTPGLSLDDLELDPQDRQELRTFLRPGARSRGWWLVRCADRQRGETRLVAAYGPEPSDDGQPVFRLVMLDGAVADIAAPFGAAFNLTEAERDVVVALLDGRSPAEIAADRGTTLQTVRSQIKALLRKTGAEDMRRLVRMAAAVARGAVLASRASGGAADAPRPGRMIVVGRRQVEWIEAGDPAGEPVVFMHGSLGGCRPPARLDIAMRKAGLRWIAPARPGHGRSDPPADAVETAVEDGLAVMDAADAPVARLLAFSTGAPFAFALASRAPARFSGLSLVAGAAPYQGLDGVRGMTPSQRAYAMLARGWPRALRFLTELGIRRLRNFGPRRLGESVFPGVAVDRATCRIPAIAEQLYEAFEFHVAQGPDAFMDDARLVMTDWRGLAGDLHVPLTILHGLEDRTVPPARALAWANALGVEPTMLPGAGHLVLWTHPEDVLAALEAR